jgi:hypothetical protein
MKIRQIISQHRRDFQAEYECEHCGHTEKDYGYDDEHFHRNVVPQMACRACSRIAPEDHRPLAPKYPAHVVV